MTTQDNASVLPNAGGVAAIPFPPVGLPEQAFSSLPAPGGYGDWLLAILVLVLAFLTASFTARNSDLWFHLAAGRLLFQGQFTFGVDPFAYTTDQVYWANHAWLFDLGFYELYTLVGGGEALQAFGISLVTTKALLVTALCGLLLSVRRPNSGTWLPVVFTTLALLAMSPRLLAQPACISYFLLGLTFWLLWRPHVTSDDPASMAGSGNPQHSCPLWPPAARHVALLPVVILWVNMDEWFLLGPLLTLLFWMGERLGGQRQTPGWLVPAALGACLINPYTFHALVLPSEVSVVTWTSGLREDPRWQAMFASPWQKAYLRAAVSSGAGLAYLILAGLGLLSFLVRRRELRGWRLLVWLPFAVLAGWHARAIPFFAVVAAPVTVLNWQDFFRSGRARQSAAGQNRASLTCSSYAGRLARRAAFLFLSLALLVLIFLTWPGWLAGSAGETRHVAWEIEFEPSLKHAAETLYRWREQGLLHSDERVFATSLEMAHYAAWFCPGEKQFFDHRFRIFGEIAREYEAVCRALLPKLPAAADRNVGGPSQDWRQVLGKYGVGIVVFHDREPQRLFGVLRRLADERRDWTLLDISGQALIAGWNAARSKGAFGPWAFDPERLAFAPQTMQAPGLAVPERGPEHLPAGRDFWTHLALHRTPLSWASAAATMQLHFFHDSRAWQDERQRQSSLSAFAASLVGLPALPQAVPQASLEIILSRHVLFPPGDSTFLVRDQLGPFFAHIVDRSPALPLLAVGAARRAVAAHPRDSNAWLRLGQAYLLLRNSTCEHSSAGLLPPLTYLRHVQIVTALEQALRLEPDLEAAHHELALLYGERKYIDRALEHHRQAGRLSRRAGQRADESVAEFTDRMQLLDRDTSLLEEQVQKGEQIFAGGSRTLQGNRLAEAAMALNLGLVRKAVDEILLPSPADLLGPAGIKLELELLLSLGRVEEVRVILKEKALRARRHALLFQDLPPPKRPDGTELYPLPYHWPAYDWLHLLQAAAVGDYAEGREAVRAIRDGLHAGHERLKQRLRDFEPSAVRLVPALLSGPTPPFLPTLAAQALAGLHHETTLLRRGEPALRSQEADLYVLEGLLALEQGHIPGARLAFQEAEKLCREPSGEAISFAGRPIAAAYLQKLNGYQ
jgi:tetratricopeptide (TPR) repeat protein